MGLRLYNRRTHVFPGDGAESQDDDNVPECVHNFTIEMKFPLKVQVQFVILSPQCEMQDSPQDAQAGDYQVHPISSTVPVAFRT